MALSFFSVVFTYNLLFFGSTFIILRCTWKVLRFDTGLLLCLPSEDLLGDRIGGDVGTVDNKDVFSIEYCLFSVKNCDCFHFKSLFFKLNLQKKQQFSKATPHSSEITSSMEHSR